MEVEAMTCPQAPAPGKFPITRTTIRHQIAALASIVAVSIISYWPAVDRFFISDDFDLFAVIEDAERSPRWFFETTTEFFRLMSYLYFGVCYWLFGLNPEPYYWAGIALHAIVSVLVFYLVRELTGSSLSAWTAGLFFAVYERHQEPICNDGVLCDWFSIRLRVFPQSRQDPVAAGTVCCNVDRHDIFLRPARAFKPLGIRIEVTSFSLE
jgi:hypothetical protein